MSLKSSRLNRRQFLKLGMLGAGAVAASPLLSIAGAPSQEAIAAAHQPQLAIPQPTFNAIASATTFGSPTDLSAGWDGALWAIDASGAPHLYDLAENTWLPHGDGIDAAAHVNNTLYFFRGSAVLQLNTSTSAATLSTIAEVFPKVPDSFKLGVVGAANVGNTLVLFNGGRYVRADGSAPPQKLTDLPGWPQTEPWKDGLITSVFGDGTNLILMNGAANLNYLNLLTGAQLGSVGTIDGIFDWGDTLPQDWLTSGFDAGFPYDIGPELHYALFKGTAVAQFVAGSTSRVALKYIPVEFKNWPATWHPQLQHAPSGRMGNLWCATQSNAIVRHDGETWAVMPGTGLSVSVGQDGVVMVGNVGGLFRWNGASYDALGGSDIAQVSVGDAGHVWARTTANNVFKLLPDGSGFDPKIQLTDVTHLAANTDGTVWHCKLNDANAYRLLSESNVQQAGLPVKQDAVTAVQRVAATSFGAAYCLAQQNTGPQVYRYDSPYVFKSQKLGANVFKSGMTSGLGRLYFLTATAPLSPNPVFFKVIALDVHTGNLVSSSIETSKVLYSGLVFDPLHDLLYVTASTGVFAFDARDLTRLVWQFDTPASVDAPPLLNGTSLVFGDRTGVIYTFDTSAAFAAATHAPPQAISPKWTWRPPTYATTDRRVTTPVIQSNRVFAVVWDLAATPPGSNELFYIAWWVSCNAADGSDGQVAELHRIGKYDDITRDLLVTQPMSGPVVNNIPSFFVNGGDAVVVAGAGGGSTFALPTGRQISTGFGYDPDEEMLWFGAGTQSGNGTLYGLNKSMQPINHTPNGGGPNQMIHTTPVVYKDMTGQTTILYGIFDSSVAFGSLTGFDPLNGNIASAPTGVTMITAMSDGVANGVIYVGGSVSPSSPAGGNDIAQAFGIRVDKLAQGLRSFVIESQMMQDPDESGLGNIAPDQSLPDNPIPNSIARYQTHLTVLDAQKNPVPHEPIKIWCDTPGTTITIDGDQSFTVGPDDASFATVKTGSDGALVIMMRATDYFAPTLRVWASFMDAYERVLIHADAEFHQRVMTTHADAGDTDPAKVNLQTATNYKGTSLFTAAEKSANPSQPHNVANSIQKVNAGLGLSKGSGNSKGLYRKLMRAMGVKHKNQRVQVTMIETTSEAAAEAAPEPASVTEKYMAYADLSGATSFPTNIPAARPATIRQPIGMSFIRPDADCSKAPVFASMSHIDARAAIDALEGTPWQPSDQPQNKNGGCTAVTPARAANSGAMRPRQTFNIFQDFWNWLKNLFDKIAQVILSIAEDILAGIQYVMDGLLKVFKAIIKVLEDVFPFLGSFFKMLEKVIDDVAEALSVLFNFGEIIKTHDLLKTQLTNLKDTVRTALTTTVKTDVTNFFNTAETSIKNAFQTLHNQLTPNLQISNLHGMGTTPHTAFQARTGAVGPTSGGSSNAVQCSWGLQKLKTNLPKANANAGGRSTSLAHPGPMNANDAISDFIGQFFASLSDDPTLKAVFAQTQADIHRLLKPNSASQFFTTGLDVLLDILETLLEGMIAVGKAFMVGEPAQNGKPATNGMLGIIDTLFDAVWNFLNAPIDIPVISWLYQTLFKAPLTILDALLLVAAIPVTVLYRVVRGQYPSQAVTQALAMQPQSSQADATATAKLPTTVMEVMGLMSGVFSIVGGMISGMDDLLVDESPDWMDQCVFGLGLLSQVPGYPLFSSDTPTSGDYAEWGLNVAMACFGVFSLQEDAEFETLSVIGSVLSLSLLVATIVVFIADGQTDGASDAGLAEGIIGLIPGLLNPFIYLPEPAALIIAIVDVVAGLATGGIQMALAMSVSAPNPGQRPLYLPSISTQ